MEVLICLWYDFRNDSGKGDSPFTVTECVFVHNYAMQYIGKKKFGKSFWSSAGPLAPIRTKFEAYLQGIDYRLKILEDTPRNNFNGTIVKSVQLGLFKDYDTKLTYQNQKKAAQDVMLAMDEDLCKQYGKMSTDFLTNIDVTTEANIGLLQ